MNTTYKVECVELEIEKGKWYETSVSIDSLKTSFKIESILNDYEQLGYECVSITPLIQSKSSGSYALTSTNQVIIVFKKAKL